MIPWAFGTKLQVLAQWVYRCTHGYVQTEVSQGEVLVQLQVGLLIKFKNLDILLMHTVYWRCKIWGWRHDSVIKNSCSPSRGPRTLASLQLPVTTGDPPPLPASMDSCAHIHKQSQTHNIQVNRNKINLYNNFKRSDSWEKALWSRMLTVPPMLGFSSQNPCGMDYNHINFS